MIKFLNTLLCLLSLLIFPRSGPLISFEGPDKITQIVESVTVGDICDGIIGGGELVACLFDTLPVQIIHRCLMGHFRKKTAEIFGRHGNGV